MKISDLRDEYESELIGEKLLAEIVDVARSVSSRYDPRIYAGTERWGDAVDDLVQDVVAELLIGEGQIHYLFEVATTLEAFRSLLRRQMRRALSRRRIRTVIDAILDRARPILESEFTVADVGGNRRYAPAGMTVEHRDLADAELRTAALAALAIPVSRSTVASERAPQVYTTAHLSSLLHSVGKALPCSFTVGDLDRVLRMTLTPWIGTNPSTDREDEYIAPDELVITSDQAAETVERIITMLDMPERRLLARKLAGVSDSEISGQLGISRPTVAKRKARVLEIIRAELNDLSEGERDAVVQSLSIRLSESSQT